MPFSHLGDTFVSTLPSARSRLQVAIDAGRRVNILWQLPAYFVLTASEVLVSIVGLQFSFTQVPRWPTLPDALAHCCVLMSSATLRCAGKCCSPAGRFASVCLKTSLWQHCATCACVPLIAQKQLARTAFSDKS